MFFLVRDNLGGMFATAKKSLDDPEREFTVVLSPERLDLVFNDPTNASKKTTIQFRLDGYFLWDPINEGRFELDGNVIGHMITKRYWRSTELNTTELKIELDPSYIAATSSA